MAARTSWKGHVQLGLVSVPVKAFTANQTSETIRLNQLHKDCNQRVRYKKVCPEHGELKADEIVSGYEYTKDTYVIIEPDELAKIRSQSDRAVSIQGFVPSDEIDPIYHAGRTYYLLPDGIAGNRPYALLAQGMVEAGVHAIARIVISKREQLVMLRPMEGLLAMTMISYAKKVKPITEFRDQLTDEDTSEDELKLTQTLIEASRIDEFDLGAYEDAYAENLKKLIEMKLEGEEIVQAVEAEEPKIINLMDALKQSVAEAQAGQRKMAPSAKGKKKKAKKKSAKKTG